MRATDLCLVWVLTLCVAASGCATTTAPQGFLPDTREAQTDTYGSWIDFTYRAAGGVERLQGELIAVATDSLWVLAATGGRAVSTASLVEGRLTEFDARYGQVAGGAFLGFLSTISNGWFLVFTGPLWIIVGTAAAAGQSNLPMTPVTASTLGDLAAFARFPQGLPAGISLADLEAKPTAR